MASALASAVVSSSPPAYTSTPASFISAMSALDSGPISAKTSSG